MTASWPDYELIDFGAGRKLERFGAWVLDRPCPAATGETVAKPQAWGEAVAKYDATRVGGGCWIPQLDLEDQHDSWCHVPVAAGFRLFVYPRPAGQVGVFPEQFSNWQWIAKQVARTQESLRVLNLFAYTGGSTLAAAVAGAEVTHVDAAKQAIERASFNANQEYPIRWIVEDVLKFCQREVRRGNRYDAVILDPPSYGHGPKGEEWLIQRDLLPLLQLCGELTSERRSFVLCTCHTPDIGPAELSAYLSDGLFGHCSQPPRSGKLFLQTAEGRKLLGGVFARWPE